MNRKLLTILSAAALLATSDSFAAALYQVPPAPCIWTATFQYKNELVPPKNPKDPRELKTFERMQLLTGRPKIKAVYETAGMRREVIQWVIGRTTENWTVGNLFLFSALNFPEGEISYKIIPGDKKGGFDSSNLNFPELSWVKAGFYAGRVTFAGVLANHFTNPPPKKKPPGAQPDATPDDGSLLGEGTPAPKQEAWIDAKTGFPLGMEDPNVHVSYKLLKQTPTDANMTMPPAYEALWKHLKDSGI